MGILENASEGGIVLAIMREAQGLPDRTGRGNQMTAVGTPENAAKTSRASAIAEDFSKPHSIRQSGDKIIPAMREAIDCTRNHQAHTLVRNGYLRIVDMVFKHQNQ